MHMTAEIKAIIHNALSEDIGTGDVTSASIIPPSTHLRGAFLAKAHGIIAGLEVVREVFAQVDETASSPPNAWPSTFCSACRGSPP